MQIKVTARQYLEANTVYIEDDHRALYKSPFHYMADHDHRESKGLQQHLKDDASGLIANTGDVLNIIEAKEPLHAENYVRIPIPKEEQARLKAAILNQAVREFNLASFTQFLLVLDFFIKFRDTENPEKNVTPVNVKGRRLETSPDRLGYDDAKVYFAQNLKKQVEEFQIIERLDNFLSAIYNKLKNGAKNDYKLLKEIKEHKDLKKLADQLLTPQPKAKKA